MTQHQPTTRAATRRPLAPGRLAPGGLAAVAALALTVTLTASGAVLAAPADAAARHTSTTSSTAASTSSDSGARVVFSRRDYRKDAFAHTHNDNGTVERDGSSSSNDISGVTVSVLQGSQGRSLRVAISTRMDYGEDYNADVRIATAANRIFHAGYTIFEPDRSSYLVERVDGKDKKVSCKQTAKVTRSGVVITVPLACIGNPTKLRIGVETSGVYPEVRRDGDPRGQAVTVAYDDAFRKGLSPAARRAEKRDNGTFYAGNDLGTMSGPIELP